MRNDWSRDEIALTRYAWAMRDAEEYLVRRELARMRLGIVVAGGMGLAIVALVIVGGW